MSDCLRNNICNMNFSSIAHFVTRMIYDKRSILTILHSGKLESSFAEAFTIVLLEITLSVASSSDFTKNKSQRQGMLKVKNRTERHFLSNSFRVFIFS